MRVEGLGVILAPPGPGVIFALSGPSLGGRFSRLRFAFWSHFWTNPVKGPFWAPFWGQVLMLGGGSPRLQRGCKQVAKRLQTGCKEVAKRLQTGCK